MLQPDRDTNHIRADAGHDLLLIGKLLVRRTARLDDLAVGCAHSGEMRMDFDGFNKTPASGPPALDTKRKNGPWPFGHILLRPFVVLAILQTRITHPRYKTVLVQPCRHGHGVLDMTIHAQR